MKRFEDAKNEYMNIKAPCGMEERMMEVMKNEKRKPFVLYKAVSIAACFVIASVSVLNIFPGIAHSMQDVPVIGDVLKVVTFRTYEVEEGGFEAKVETPKIEGLLDKELEEKLNKEFRENAEHIIAAFEADMKELKEEFGDDVHLGVESSYFVRTDNEDVLALDVYIVNTVASSSTRHTFYNINKKTGELMSLEGLFKKDADYITPISEYIKKEMIRRNEEEDGMFWIGGENIELEFAAIKEDQNFFINDEGNIVICFDKYEVAAGGQGCPEFEIADEVVEDILK